MPGTATVAVHWLSFVLDNVTPQAIAVITYHNIENVVRKLLDPSGREIRLLELMTASCLQDPLECKLSTVSLHCSQDYTALSYIWGDAADTVDITINGLRTPVTKNLESTLRYLRQISKQSKDVDCSIKKLSTRLWVDAICINQQDDDEKNCQVQRMRDIYSKASLVVSWLGQDDDGCMSLAMKTIEIVVRETSSGDEILRDLEWLRQYPWLFTEDGNIPDIPNASWDAIRLFCDNPCWKRVWILQECVLASSLCIFSGLIVLDFTCWEKFDLFRESLASKDVNHVFATDLKFYLTQPRAFGAGYIILTDSLRRNPVSQTRFVFDIFLATARHLATDPRDKIFAVQGVIGQALTSDYKASVYDIYSSFAKEWLSSSKLSILRWSGIST